MGGHNLNKHCHESNNLQKITLAFWNLFQQVSVININLQGDLGKWDSMFNCNHSPTEGLMFTLCWLKEDRIKKNKQEDDRAHGLKSYTFQLSM